LERAQAVEEVRTLLQENGITLTHNLKGFIMTGPNNYREENCTFSTVLKTLFLYLPLYEIRYRKFLNDPYGFYHPNDPSVRKLVSDIQNFISNMENYLNEQERGNTQ